MRAYGSKRSYHLCRVVQAGNGKKIKFTVGVKSRKSGRKIEKEQYNEVETDRANAESTKPVRDAGT